jgi:uncharacterized protein (TIGR02145 family)
VYEENHSTTTSNGLVNLTVGMGNAVNGVFAQIDWGAGNKHLQVLMNNGSGEIDLGTQQMMSVPYALHADDISINVSSTGDTLTLGSSSVIVPGISNSTNGTNYQYAQGAGVTDIDGNFYPSVIIGNQEWTTQNLRVTRYNDGTSFNPSPSNPTSWNFQQAAFCSYLGDENNDFEYGKIYNLYAARGHNSSDVWSNTINDKNLCPTGWHVPIVADYLTLLCSINKSTILNQVYIGGLSFWNDFTEGLKSPTTWPQDVFTSERNSFGFNAKSLGLLGPSSSTPVPTITERAYFFTKDFYLSGTGPSTGYAVEIQNSSDGLNRTSLVNLQRETGAFIRCIKD